MALEVFEGTHGSEMLQDTFLFRNLNFSEAQALSRLCHYERRRRGEVIIEEGSLGQALYLIQSGRVKVLKGEDERQEEVAELGPSELFGEMSLIEDALTSASVVADSDVELLVIRREDFERLLSENESLALKVYKSFCRTLSERLRRTSQELGHSLAQVHLGERAESRTPAGRRRRSAKKSIRKSPRRKKGAKA